MHGRDTIEPTRSPRFGGAEKPVTIDVLGVENAVAQIRWDEEVQPPPALRLVIGGAQRQRVDSAEREVAGAADEALAVTAAGVDTDRWINEGGSVDAEISAVLRVVTWGTEVPRTRADSRHANAQPINA